MTDKLLSQIHFSRELSMCVNGQHPTMSIWPVMGIQNICQAMNTVRESVVCAERYGGKGKQTG